MEKPKLDHHDDASEYSATHVIQNSLRKSIGLEYTKRTKQRDKKDLSTTQQVFDRKTLSILNKFVVNNIFTQLDECISTGKEAVVFNATNPTGERNYAVKVYKTMVMDFKDREEYISGEYRFRHKGKNKRTNPHKLIRDWAEKEFRNYKRLTTAGINCPKALYLKHNVLVMELVGKKGQVAKRLRDTNMSTEKMCGIYLEIVKIMRYMFIKAKLVHGDLSEFNLLYDNDQVVVIDVSQSVEDNHPMAIEFLKRDMYNVNEYFKKHGVIVFKLRDIFHFVTDTNIKEEEEDDKINILIDSVKDIDGEYIDQDAEVFMGVNIPRSLHDIDLYTMEKHIFVEKKVKDQLYSNLTGLNPIKEHDDDNDSSESSDSSDDNNSSDDDDEASENDVEDSKKNLKLDDIGGDEEKPKCERFKRDAETTPAETADEKRERKQQVKEEKREKRKVKIPKKVKKKMEKLKKNGKKH